MSRKMKIGMRIYLILIFGMIVLLIGLDIITNKIIYVSTDIEFVQSKFPNIEDIEEVRYFYNVRSNKRQIGLQDIEFCGFIKIGEDFYEKIVQEYKWKETKKSKKIVPKSILMKGDNEEYHFLYNYDFSNDGNYKSHSWGGDFYLDTTHRVLYFECYW